MDETRRAFLWHGVFLILVGLLTGILIPLLRNPRLGLSAHVGGVSNGMILLLFGLVWRELRLTPALASACFWSALFALYGIWGFTLLGGAFGTSQANPIAGAGFEGAPWQEAMVTAGLTAGGVASLVAVGIVLYGLRGGAREP
jgi:hydroxylaminobenzene mutase